MRCIMMILVVCMIIIITGCMNIAGYDIKEGYKLLNDGDTYSARKHFESIISRHSDNHTLSYAYEGIGWTYIISYDVDNAITYFKTALNYNEKNTDALYGMVVCKWKKKDLYELMNLCEKFVERKSFTFTKVYRYRAEWEDIMKILLSTYVILGKFNKAKDIIETIQQDEFVYTIGRVIEYEIQTRE